MGDADADTVAVSNTFRYLVDSADRKFARVRDLPSYGGGGHQHHYLQKVFKAYTKLWKFQQENRQELVESGLKRWEIGEIASRIGQLYYGQYLRTSEARFLLESYVFYEAILNRGYFQCPAGAPKDLVLRYKELRFYARFLVVSMVLNRTEMVRILVDRFKALVDDSKVAFPETNFKEWKQVVQEIVRFLKVDTAFMNIRPLRYCLLFDSHPSSVPRGARFQARNLKLQDALLTSFRRNEVKFTELTLDTFRMLQCLEWEPSGTFYQMRTKESNSNGAFTDQSGLIDINLAVDMTDPTLPPNPRKAILYRPSVTHLISVLALICEELPHDSIMLMYISASGKAGQNIACQKEISRAVKNSSNLNTLSQTFRHHNSSLHKPLAHDKGDSADSCGSCLYLGSRGNEGSNNLYPGDIIPFTRRPLFLIIDSDCSHAFKAGEKEEDRKLIDMCKHWRHKLPVCFKVRHNVSATENILQAHDHFSVCFQKVHEGEVVYVLTILMDLDIKVIHGEERGEKAALLLSHESQVFHSPSSADPMQNGSQFTFFLTAPLQAFCQLAGLSTLDMDINVYNKADNILSSAFSKWEVILFRSDCLDQVWAQVLSDPFLRRLILRFIFCRSVLSMFCPLGNENQYLPDCLPQLPDSVSPSAEAVQIKILRLAKTLGVSSHFQLTDTIRTDADDSSLESEMS